MTSSKTVTKTALVLIFIAMLLTGCASGPTASQPASPLYLLTTAGFQPWPVNLQTPKSQALMNSIPPGKLVTYTSDGTTYHVYADETSQTLYFGDEAAYRKYLVMSQGQQLCERVEGQNPQHFWGCFVEFQEAGGKPRAK